MRKKYINNNYYVSPYPERFLQKRQQRNIVWSSLTLVLYFPILIFWIVGSGLKSLIWIFDSYAANMMFVISYFSAFVGLGFCIINNFYGYKIRKEVKQKKGPILGFARMAYNGQFITAVLVTVFAVYMSVIFTGYHFANGFGYISELIAKRPELAGKTAGLDVSGIIALALAGLSVLTVWRYYIGAYRANKDMEFIEVDEPKKKRGKRARKQLPMYGLSDEEKEACRGEFVGGEPDLPAAKKS